jgi:DNA-binding CsgD family transcriptional regulator
VGGPASRRSILAERLVGRGEEFGALREALSAATANRGGVVVVAGEAGIGKSRLVREVVAEAVDRGLAVLQGRAVQAASPVAYRPFAEALCAAVRAGGLPDSPELAPFRPTLGRLVPEWQLDHGQRADDSFVMLGEAILRFLRNAGDKGGALLVLEDVHWADPESLAILEYLADNLDREHVLCIATLRLDERRPGVELVRTLAARRACVFVELGRLADDDMTRMVGSCLRANDVLPEVLSLAARADGVPFLVEELLAAAVASGALVDVEGVWVLARDVEPVVPFTFADTVRRRLTTLGSETRAVLAAAAVLGRSFDWELLPAVAGATESDVLAALRGAVDAHLVVVDEDDASFRFRHALSRDAVLRELLPPERAGLSVRALRAVEAAHPELAEPWAELSAELAEAAGDRTRAATLLLEIGRRSLARGALTSAERSLERARGLAPSAGPIAVEVELVLAEVLSLAGKPERVGEVCTSSLLSRLADDPATSHRRAEPELWLARAAVAATRWDEAREHVALARAHAVEANDERLTARVDALGAHTAIGEHKPVEATALARAALAVAERVGLPDVACEALEVIGRCARPKDLEAAEAAFARAHVIADEHGLVVWKIRALHELGTIDLLSGGEVMRLENARDLALAAGALATAAVIDLQIAAGLTIRDAPEASLAQAERAAELARRYRLELPYAAARAFEGHARARRHQHAQMEECLADATLHGHGDPGVDVIVETCQGLSALAEEDRSSALSHLGAAAALSFSTPGDQSTGPSPGIWALVRAVSEPERQVALTDVPEWWRPNHWIARLYGDYAEAVIRGRRHEAAHAAAIVAAADRELAAFEWFRHVARRLVAEAALADGWGEPVLWLREALAFFESDGDDRLAAACRSLLRSAGSPVPRRHAGDDDVPVTLRGLGVTGRELEVLQLLGQGLSNKEIGKRLFLSPRTVERHVANLTVKTDVEGRSQLVSFAARRIRPPD